MSPASCQRYAVVAVLLFTSSIAACTTLEPVAPVVSPPASTLVPTTSGPTTTTVTIATTSIATTSTTEPHTDAPIDLEVLELPQAFAEIADGMVLAGHTFTGGGDMRSWLAVTGESRAQKLVGSCYWDGWTLTPPLATKEGGMILYQGGDLTLCTPHEAPLLLARRASATGIGHFSSGDQLMAEIRDTRAVIDLTTGAALWSPPEDLSIASASGAQDTWLILFESSTGPLSDRDHQIQLFDISGHALAVVDPDTPAGARVAAAALDDDARRVIIAIEFEDGRTDLVTWDLATRRPVGTSIEVIEPFEPGDDPYGWGRQFVAYVDVSGQRVALTLATVEAENFLSGLLVVDASGGVHDLTRGGDHSVIAGSFIP